MTHIAAPQAQPAAAGGKSMESPTQSGGKAITLQFNDNTLLPMLLGDHDRHMVRIEQALGVRLACRGNRVAIDDLRAQAGGNPSNAHLRYQLLAMYQEKQRTLEEVLEAKR